MKLMEKCFFIIIILYCIIIVFHCIDFRANDDSWYEANMKKYINEDGFFPDIYGYGW